MSFVVCCINNGFTQSKKLISLKQQCPSLNKKWNNSTVFTNTTAKEYWPPIFDIICIHIYLYIKSEYSYLKWISNIDGTLHKDVRMMFKETKMIIFTEGAIMLHNVMLLQIWNLICDSSTIEGGDVHLDLYLMRDSNELSDRYQLIEIVIISDHIRNFGGIYYTDAGL